MTDKSTSTIAPYIEDFIRNEYRVSPGDPRFSADVHLWEEGYLDSMGVVEVISFVETTFDVKIPEMALFSEDFTSINGMANIVASLMAARQESLAASGTRGERDDTRPG